MPLRGSVRYARICQFQRDYYNSWVLTMGDACERRERLGGERGGEGGGDRFVTLTTCQDHEMLRQSLLQSSEIVWMNLYCKYLKRNAPVERGKKDERESQSIH